MESKIKEVALQLFAEKGYEGTSMREIGNKVGIKGSSIYSHFQSKEDIFIHIVQDLFTKIMEEVEGLYDIHVIKKDTDVKNVLFQIFSGFYRFFAIHEIELLFWQRIRFFPHKVMEGKYNAYQLFYEIPIDEIFMDLFNYGIKTKQLKDNSAELLAMSYHAFVSGFIDSLIVIPFELSDVELQTTFDFFWNGLI